MDKALGSFFYVKSFLSDRKFRSNGPSPKDSKFHVISKSTKKHSSFFSAIKVRRSILGIKCKKDETFTEFLTSIILDIKRVKNPREQPTVYV